MSLVLRPGQKWFFTSCSRRLFSQEVVRENDIVLLKARNDSKLAPVLTPPLKAGELIYFKDHRWKLRADDVIGKTIRDTVTNPKKVSYRIYKPTLADYVILSPRKVTPIYPKDANLIVSLLDLNPSVPNEANKSQNEARMEIFEAGTGHGALTLHLARAIHGANTAAPPIPELTPNEELGDKEKVYNQWRANRRAVIHTLDSSRQHSEHARMTVKNFRNGIYYPHVDFHVGNINEYLSRRLSEVGDVFLDHGILDLPDTQDEMEIVGNCMKPSGILITFCPSVTQIIRCLRTVKDKNLRFALESVVELGSGLSGGREWDIRLIKPRALLKAAAEARRLSVVEEGAVTDTDSGIEAETPESGHRTEATNEVSEISETDNTDSGSPTLNPENTVDSSGWEMVCKPMVGTRITVGGFVGVWRKIYRGRYMLIIHKVRTITQLGALTIFSIIVVYFLDNRYRVLPSALHDYMPAHHPGLVITDVIVTKCSRINVFASCKLDSDKWHRIEKDLYLGEGWVSSAYVHVQRKKEEELTTDDKVVLDVRVGRLDPATGTKGEGDERWEARPAGIWLKRSAKRHASDSNKAVTSVDVLFGADAVDPRDGWEMVGTPLLLDTSGEVQEARLSIRRGKLILPTKPKPRIRDNGKFKILQAADLHLSTGTGHCREPMPNDGTKCEADPRTLEFVGRLLDEEKPDLVVLSGDQINGDTAPDAQSAIFKYAELFIKRKIPFATIFGNHDDEGSLPRPQQMALIESLPYSLSEAGPDEIEGVGNYIVEVLAQGTSKHSALTIYLLDTHAYSPDERSFKGYDWLKKNQIDWFKQTAEGLKKEHSGYTHIHMDLAFIHIPLPEYRDNDLYHFGEWREGVTAPAFNSGFRDALVEQGVVMVSCGHDHANEYCALSRHKKDETPALWMCYGGGAGFGGYGGYGGYHRRIRLFEIDMNAARITTYKRLEYGDLDKRVDEQVIVDGGKAVAPNV
ncbi:calcineurin-like phosphoesterase protein [Rutstroemia sp. NJR-2017a BVV2]|nr:calcineurin-like phosphoesterase protein [Rutstroemia sp. NJR-2017a BVV2]